MIASEESEREGESMSACVGEEDLSHSFEVDLKDLPHVLNYIKRLNEHIKRQQNVLSKLYVKLKEYKERCTSVENLKGNTCDATTQTDCADFVDADKRSEWNTGSFVGNNLAEEVKKVAENAMQQTGFVYEETSGMYYDYNTGYYYNAELGLYYDGHSGTYMYYNEATKCYEYHSQTTPTTSQSTLNHLTQCQESHFEVPVVSANHHEVSLVSNHSESLCENELKKPQPSKGILKEEKKHRRKSHDGSPRRSDGSAEEGECSDSSSNLEETDIKSKRKVVKFSETDKIVKYSSKRKLREEWSVTKEQESDVEAGLVSDKKPKGVSNSRRFSDEANAAWPPCMRIIVQETDVRGLSVGNLFIVTCKGGTLGRERSHAVCIPDINISKHHGKFSFDEKNGGQYFLIDYGSRNGTYVNKKRLSAAKQESEPCEITHGTIVTLGSTNLLCHIHPGRETCEECEPGVVAAKKAEDFQDLIIPHPKTRENKSEMRKLELKRLRKRFGLESNDSKGDLLGAGYEDRAEIRRTTVGSLNEHAKTESASVTESIKSSNKGFEMLSKMGWKQGDSLGKDGTGLVEPVLVSQRADKAGLGSDGSFLGEALLEADPRAKRKADMWVRAQHRYDQIGTAAASGHDDGVLGDDSTATATTATSPCWSDG